jgi:hypothetical protein
VSSIRFGGILAIMLLIGCGGSNSNPSSTLPAPGSAGASLGATSPYVSAASEKVFILDSSCPWSNPMAVDVCDAFTTNSKINSYNVATGVPIGSVQTSSQVGVPQILVSPNDEYTLANQQIDGLAVYGPSGTATFPIGTSAYPLALTSSGDLSSDFAIVQTTSPAGFGLYEFHSPFTAAVAVVPVSQGGVLAANQNGSQAYLAQQLGSAAQTTVSVFDMASEKLLTTIDVPMSQAPGGPWGVSAPYDNISGAMYFFASNATGSPLNQIDIVSISKSKYEGYINLPGPPSGMVLYQPSQTLYVFIGNRVYLYDVHACGCATPTRSFAVPYTGTPALDLTGTHLFVSGVSGDEEVVADINPQTGAVIRTYLQGQTFPAGPPPSTLNFVQDIVAQ